jgi:hypothetical protein
MAYGVFYAEMARDLGPWARDGLSTGGPVFFIFLDKRHWKFFPIFVLLFEIGIGLAHPPAAS